MNLFQLTTLRCACFNGSTQTDRRLGENSFRKSCRTNKSPCENTNVFLKSNIIFFTAQQNNQTPYSSLTELFYVFVFRNE